MALARAASGQAVTLDPPDGPLAAQTAALVKADHFEAIHLVVPEGREIAEHAVEGPITLFCLEGEAEIGLPDGRVTLAAGQWLYLDGGVPHSVYGIRASRLLLTIVLVAAPDK